MSTEMWTHVRSELLALTGRHSACDELEGDGVGSLRQRSRDDRRVKPR